MTLPGFADVPAGARVVVAMSGGVDSSVVAGLAKRAGFDVVGITLQLYDHGAAIGRKGACCAGADIHDARDVAEKLAIPHYVLDFQERFRRDVMADFARSYVAGETPVPCVACNRTVKFRDLLDVARDLGAAALATGHYARRIVGVWGPELHMARDASRDQSYFLHATTRAQLDFLRFPLGDLAKHETRAIAQSLGLGVAEKPDSQDICFVPAGRYADVVRKFDPTAEAPGEIVDAAGQVLGRHDGIYRFTVGQRRGIGVGGTGEPLYVLRVEPATRRVVVGPRAALATHMVRLRDGNWLGEGDGPAPGARYGARVRSTGDMRPVTVTSGGDNPVIAFDEPEPGVAPGQAAVFHRDTRVLGGYTIMREAGTRSAA